MVVYKNNVDIDSRYKLSLVVTSSSIVTAMICCYYAPLHDYSMTTQ